jgi:hypothetical protein
VDAAYLVVYELLDQHNIILAVGRLLMLEERMDRSHQIHAARVCSKCCVLYICDLGLYLVAYLDRCAD